MKNQELIDRYVYAVVKHLPRKQAEDIDRELHGLIEDMLTERCGERPAEQKDVLVILTELGTPQELAVQYSEDKEKCLIAQPWYNQYKLVLKWVLFAAFLGVTIAMVVSIVTDAVGGQASGLGLCKELLQWIGTIFSTSLTVVGAVTLMYAYLQRKGIHLEENGGFSANLMDLPPVPKKQETVSKADGIATIVFSVLAMCICIFVPQILCGVFHIGDETEVISVFNGPVIRGIWYLFVGMMVCGVINGIFELLEGRYTMRLAIVTGICNLCSVILTALFVTTRDIINPAFLAKTGEVFAGEDAWLGEVFFPNILNFFFLFIALAMLVDFGVVLFKALKYRRK